MREGLIGFREANRLRSPRHSGDGNGLERWKTRRILGGRNQCKTEIEICLLVLWGLVVSKLLDAKTRGPFIHSRREPRCGDSAAVSSETAYQRLGLTCRDSQGVKITSNPDHVN